jgi:hypothetical protein
VSNTLTELEDVAKLPLAERLTPLVTIGRRLLEQGANGSAATILPLLVEAIESGAGTRAERTELGVVLGHLGDPRLRTPDAADYWVEVEGPESGTLQVGRFAVTNAEFFAFEQSGGYTTRDHWTDEGWAWLQSTAEPWPAHARNEAAASLVVANQPVVGVTFHEATAYAASVGARLPRADERVFVVRGKEKRPYPWGAPFGEGNAATREEVLQRPCAVGLFVNDRTPDGVRDLAGNVAEWTSDQVGEEYLIHPGAYDQPSMAAWAKALTMAGPDARWAGLGFRLVR